MGAGEAVRRTALFGGTFNPVHAGHLVVAQDACEQFELDEVIFLPCARPPHKDALPLAEGRHRLAMIEGALEGDPRFSVSGMELERGGASYTVDTLDAMRRRRPDDRLFFIIGSDSLLELHTWRAPERLLELADFITVSRPGFRAPSEASLGLPPEAARSLLQRVCRAHALDISSSDIRRRVAEGLSIRYLVPSFVEMYIAEHGLYRDGS